MINYYLLFESLIYLELMALLITVSSERTMLGFKDAFLCNQFLPVFGTIYVMLTDIWN